MPAYSLPALTPAQITQSVLNFPPILGGAFNDRIWCYNQGNQPIERQTPPDPQKLTALIDAVSQNPRIRLLNCCLNFNDAPNYDLNKIVIDKIKTGHFNNKEIRINTTYFKDLAGLLRSTLGRGAQKSTLDVVLTPQGIEHFTRALSQITGKLKLKLSFENIKVNDFKKLNKALKNDFNIVSIRRGNYDAHTQQRTLNKHFPQIQAYVSRNEKYRTLFPEGIDSRKGAKFVSAFLSSIASNQTDGQGAELSNTVQAVRDSKGVDKKIASFLHPCDLPHLASTAKSSKRAFDSLDTLSYELAGKKRALYQQSRRTSDASEANTRNVLKSKSIR